MSDAIQFFSSIYLRYKLKTIPINFYEKNHIFTTLQLSVIFVNKITFHKYNIENFPKHKEVMDNWISISAKRHQEFQKNIKAKPNHYLSLNKYIGDEYQNEESSNTPLVEQIKELNELYKSGALTKEEFEKAKKKLLD